jgi:hypothetical protein
VPLISQTELAEYDALLQRHPKTYEPPHYVVYTNSPGPFKRAMASIEKQWARTIVIDNRALFDESLPPQELVPGVRVYKPDCALYIAQVLTMLITMTQAMGHSYFTWMHDDADVPEGAFEGLLDFVEAKNSEEPDRWSIIFTRTEGGQADVLCAYNVGPCLTVGGYDWLSFPSYHADAHFYGRLKKAGFEQYQTNILVGHSKNNDRTLNTSDRRFRAHGAYDEASRKFWYSEKEREGLPG